MIMKVVRVYLNVYDFVSFNNCLAPIGMGGYHTAIEVENKQFCFCVVSSNPSDTGVIVIEPQSADFHFNRKIFLGEVETDNHRFQTLLRDLAKEFTCGKYHMFENNCNHFSNAFVKKLLGIELQSWIFRSTNLLTYLCCCLPHKIVSGQWGFEQLMKQEGFNEGTEQTMLKQ